MRHLPATDIPAALRRGEHVEQFIGPSPAGVGYIRHVELRPVSNVIEVWVYDVEDIGSESTLDLYEFPTLEPDGADMPVATFAGAVVAVDYASGTLKADPDRWVRGAVIQDEYLDYIQAGRPPCWPAPRGNQLARAA